MRIARQTPTKLRLGGDGTKKKAYVEKAREIQQLKKKKKKNKGGVGGVSPLSLLSVPFFRSFFSFSPVFAVSSTHLSSRIFSVTSSRFRPLCFSGKLLLGLNPRRDSTKAPSS